MARSESRVVGERLSWGVAGGKLKEGVCGGTWIEELGGNDGGVKKVGDGEEVGEGESDCEVRAEGGGEKEMVRG